MPSDLIQVISDLMTGGLPILALYLYFQERLWHKETRDTLLKMQRELYEARIEDYRRWLEFQNDIIISGRLSTRVEVPSTPLRPPSPPAPKTVDKS